MEAHLWIWWQTTGVEPAFQNLVLRAPKSLCRLTYVRHKEFDKDFSTPELVAIGADYSGMDCRIHTDASRSFSSMRARCGSPWF